MYTSVLLKENWTIYKTHVKTIEFLSKHFPKELM